MPVNKNAALRYRIIDEALSGNRKLTFSELKACINRKLAEVNADYTGVSDRTLYNDIKIMRSDAPVGYNAPIVCQKGLYHYSDKSFTINQQPLRSEDIEAIKQALGLLKQFGHLPLLEQLAQLISHSELELLKESDPDNRILLFDTNPHLKGLERIGQLYEHIQQRRELIIEYLPFNQDHPESFKSQGLFLKEYNKRWYLIARVQGAPTTYNLALDRILSLSPTGRTYHINKDVSGSDHFNDIVGVTIPVNAELETIVFKAKRPTAHYIATKPIHHSQKTLNQDIKSITFSITVLPNYELESILLGFGENITILQPNDFKEKMAARISALHALYL